MSDFRRLPNLAALRAFEAAARHENFSRAAEEIHLTHGAISHQVRALEEELGLPLFMRHGKRLGITAEGKQFAEVIRQALGDIAQAADQLRQGHAHPTLAITALASFAARWLSPRLGRFIEQYPHLRVSLQSSNRLNDFVKDGIDIGIRFGSGNYPGLTTEHLMDDQYYPVASPNYNGGRLPQSLQELARENLLRCEGEPWQPWFKLAGMDFPEPSTGLVFQDAAIVTRAALDGQGIALGRHSLVHTDVSLGHLRKLFDTVLPSIPKYYLVYLEASLQRPQVRAFREWLLEQVAQAVKEMYDRPMQAVPMRR